MCWYGFTSLCVAVDVVVVTLLLIMCECENLNLCWMLMSMLCFVCVFEHFTVVVWVTTL